FSSDVASPPTKFGQSDRGSRGSDRKGAARRPFHVHDTCPNMELRRCMARKPPCHRLPVGGSASSSQLAVDSAARGVPLPSAEAVLQFNKSQIMQRSLPYLVALTLGFALPQGAMAQETETPEADAPAIGEPLPGAEESDPTEAGTGAETGASDAAAD